MTVNQKQPCQECHKNFNRVRSSTIVPFFIAVVLIVSIFGCESSKKPHGKNRSGDSRIATTTHSEPHIKQKTFTSSKPSDTSATRKYTNLSNDFNFQLSMKGVYYSDPQYVTYDEFTSVKIFDKKDSLLQVIRHIPTHDGYKNMNDVRSYETGFRKNAQVIDGYMGKLVVGDFNFDHLTDFALIENTPETAGSPSYVFYFQNEDKSFSKNHYFSKHVSLIPEKIDTAKRKFRTHGYAGCCFHTFKYYQVDSLGNCKMTYSVEKS